MQNVIGLLATIAATSSAVKFRIIPNGDGYLSDQNGEDKIHTLERPVMKSRPVMKGGSGIWGINDNVPECEPGKMWNSDYCMCVSEVQCALWCDEPEILNPIDGCSCMT